ncbi:hypothetical protein GRX66_06200 [Halobacterium sp. PCN9]|uniref:Uncharacterized protein n=1 Tax=Halobacterium bonnevillei TaxID=2692200 RepID=A0A6B0SKZ4_9EURY|nr:hypothetical protein [Halobacterium bonnevillei]MXR20213.1 hypothetical protein [Halobacterium bonnevillei]
MLLDGRRWDRVGEPVAVPAGHREQSALVAGFQRLAAAAAVVAERLRVALRGVVELAAEHRPSGAHADCGQRVPVFGLRDEVPAEFPEVVVEPAGVGGTDALAQLGEREFRLVGVVASSVSERAHDGRSGLVGQEVEAVAACHIRRFSSIH